MSEPSPSTATAAAAADATSPNETTANHENEPSSSSQDHNAEMAMQQRESVIQRSAMILNMTAAGGSARSLGVDDDNAAETEMDEDETKLIKDIKAAARSDIDNYTSQSQNAAPSFWKLPPPEQAPSNTSATTNSSSVVGAIAVSSGREQSRSTTPAYDSGPFELDDGNDNDHNDNDGNKDENNLTEDLESATVTTSGAVQAQPLDERQLEDELKERIFGQAVEAKAVEHHDEQKPKSNRTKWIVIVAIVVVIAVAVIVAVMVGSNRASSNASSSSSSTPGTDAPTAAATLSPSQQELMDTLLPSLPPQSQEALQDNSSPQYQAFLWLSTTDVLMSNQDVASILQQYALATFYFATNGDEWVRNDGWLEPGDPCTKELEAGNEVLFGVTCLNQPHVQELQLPLNGLMGRLPEELSLLSDLRVLDLSGSFLEGALDWESLAETLETLWLGGNSLTGTVSSTIGKMGKLRDLSLESNPLNGTLPTELGLLESLESLDLENNLFVGDIPAEVGRLTKLELWNTHDVPFSTSIPSELGLLTSLTHLELTGAVTMTGTIPESLYDLTKLNAMKVTRLGLHGTISPSIQRLSDLQVLEMGFQNLSGSLPTEIGLLGALETFRIGTNFFTGVLPTELGNLTSLKAFTLNDNLLTGSLPSQLGNLAETLESIAGDFNQLSGPIPSELGSLRKMRVFRFNDNALTGTVPQQLYANYQETFIFSLHDNQLSGTLPTTSLWRENLEMFGVGTRITGTIPTEIALAPNLKELLIHSNQLTGNIPSEIGVLSSLKAIALAENMLTGSLPAGIGNNKMDVMFLQRNGFSGPIPDSIGTQWTATKIAYFHDTNLTGSLEPLCESVDLVDVFADCDEVDCPCCSHCCDDNGVCTWTGIGQDKGEAPIAPFRPRRTRAPGANRTET